MVGVVVAIKKIAYSSPTRSMPTETRLGEDKEDLTKLLPYVFNSKMFNALNVRGY